MYCSHGVCFCPNFGGTDEGGNEKQLIWPHIHILNTSPLYLKRTPLPLLCMARAEFRARLGLGLLIVVT